MAMSNNKALDAMSHFDGGIDRPYLKERLGTPNLAAPLELAALNPPNPFTLRYFNDID